MTDERRRLAGTDERARAGLFLGMQAPAEVPGVTNSDFIKTAINAKRKDGSSVPLFKFIREYDKAVQDLKMREDLPHRFLNDGFSGGEKKRNEILQMRMLKPSIAILDEIDKLNFNIWTDKTDVRECEEHKVIHDLTADARKLIQIKREANNNE